MRYLEECGAFIRECRRHFQTTGAILPSSRFLARALASELRKTRGPATVLEVGPGTGAVTKEILRHLLPGDRLDAVEINGYFLSRLRQRFEEEPFFAARRDQVRLIHAAVQEVPGEGVYDFIISGLPLNNFPVQMVRTIFRVYDRLLRPGGILTYFEYVFIRQLKAPFASRRERRRLYRVDRVVNRYIRDYEVRRQRIFINVPPATVRHLCLKPDVAAAPAAGRP